MPPSSEPQPGDWHDALVDLLAMDRGIPEDRARRFLARHAEEVRAATPVTCHARECPCPPNCGCCAATAETVPSLDTQLTEAEALADRWEEKYFEMGEKRTEALSAIDRVQAVAREWEFMSGRTAARRELLAALDTPAKEQQ